MNDVEVYVRDTLRGLGPLAPGEEEQLVAGGIFLVRRIARALPPEASLQEALRDHLAEGMSALRVEVAPSGGPPAGTPSRRAA